MIEVIEPPRYVAHLFTWIAIAVLVGLDGCSAIKPGWKLPGDSGPRIPQVVLPIWTDTVLHQPGKPGIRGFGGRVYFYEREGADPIKVDGALTVYVFDGDEVTTGDTKPLRKFVFTADQLARHHSSSDLGDSYSVWIPWDKVGGPSRSLSLITRFDGRNGGTAISDAASNLLPGTVKYASADQPESTTGAIQQVSYDALPTREIEGDSLQEKKLSTYSMTLPPSFQRHLRSEAGTEVEGSATAQGQSASEGQQPARLPWTTETARPSSATSEAALNAEQTDQAVPTADSQPVRFPARRESTSRPVPSRFRMQPHRAGWPSALPPTPRSGIAKPIERTSAPAP